MVNGVGNHSTFFGMALFRKSAHLAGEHGGKSMSSGLSAKAGANLTLGKFR